MTQPKTSTNLTHHQRIARALHRATGCGYQKALARVTLASGRGLLPPVLDKAGREAAVRILIASAPLSEPTTSSAGRSCDMPWSVANPLADLAPGTVTALVSLPTAGRSTLALNVALHNAEQGRTCLFTSGEIQTDDLQQKVIAAKYGVDLRRQAPPEGWDAFKARAVPELEAMALALQGATTGSLLQEVFDSGRIALARRSRRLDLWVIDTVQHFSQFSDSGLEIGQAMRQVRRIAQEQRLSVLVTAQALTETSDELLGLEHVPSGVVAHSDKVLALDRQGVYWGNESGLAAALRLVKPSPARARSCALTLEPARCRFITPPSGGGAPAGL